MANALHEARVLGELLVEHRGGDWSPDTLAAYADLRRERAARQRAIATFFGRLRIEVGLEARESGSERRYLSWMRNSKRLVRAEFRCKCRLTGDSTSRTTAS